MQEIKVTEEEMKALAQFADSEGQVSKTKPETVKTLQQHKFASVCLQHNKVQLLMSLFVALLRIYLKELPNLFDTYAS